MLRHVTHNYIINFVEGLFPLASEAHCGYTSLHEYVITILEYGNINNDWNNNIKMWTRLNKGISSNSTFWTVLLRERVFWVFLFSGFCLYFSLKKIQLFQALYFYTHKGWKDEVRGNFTNKWNEGLNYRVFFLPNSVYT